jgi:hypothetical protein
MSLETLYAGYRRMMDDIYSPRQYYRRLMTFLRNYRAPSVRAPLTIGRIMALFRSMVRLGIMGRERVHYWRMLAWTALRRRELLPVAVTLAIYGFHFRQTVRKLQKPQPRTRGLKICKLHEARQGQRVRLPW